MRFSLPSLHRRITAASAGILVAIGGLQPVLVTAQQTQYTDVPTGAYYENAASALLELGALDPNETRLRPADVATRAELVKLLVSLNNQELLYPSVSSFNDVSKTAWYFPYFEAAAEVGWIHGDNNCYQKTRPCTARPPASVNRAEAAALLVRAFALERTGTAPQFADNDRNQWYAQNIQIAADHCILQGDAPTGRVRPAALMNRAEMIVMFHRAYLNMEYGTDCGTASGHISEIETLDDNHIRITFDTDVNAASMQNIVRYSVARVGGGETVGISSAARIDARTVDLTLRSDLATNASYLLTVQNMMTGGGMTFGDSHVFSFETEGGKLTGASALSSTRVRLTFDNDLDRNRAEDESRYAIERISLGGTIGIRTATLIDSRTVDLELASSMVANSAYRVSVAGLMTEGGTSFSDSASFSVSAQGTGSIAEVTAVSPTKLRVKFDVDVDPIRAEQSNRYSVTDDGHTLDIRTAQLIDSRTVELSLLESMETQRSYTVNALSMNTNDGATFSDTANVTYDAGGVTLTATLSGGQQSPVVITTARGSGSFILTANNLHYDVTVQGLSGAITAAHFHSGGTGISGPVIQPIVFVGNRAVGDWPNLTPEQRNMLLDGDIYVNVHTALHPDGEIRGQLTRQ